ncbi:MAG TPA: hypothetical protein VF628_11190 [Allosphingosinicella sp.]
MNIATRVERAVQPLRVTPPVPSGRLPEACSEQGPIFGSDRDQASGWCGYISYQNAKGERSERRITCHRIEGFGGPEVVMAYCHESRRAKSFRIDRIIELIDYSTGEVCDPKERFELLCLHGALPVHDKALVELAKILVFMARCDGRYHPLEVAALEHAFGRYALRYGGSDKDLERVLVGCDSLAPDGRDLTRSLDKIAASAVGPQLARLVLDSSGAVIDADGRHAPEEVTWGIELSEALKTIAAQR